MPSQANSDVMSFENWVWPLMTTCFTEKNRPWVFSIIFGAIGITLQVLTLGPFISIAISTLFRKGTTQVVVAATSFGVLEGQLCQLTAKSGSNQLAWLMNNLLLQLSLLL